MGNMDNGPHIVSAFDEELMGIRAKLAEMGGLAEQMLSDAIEGVERRDIALCEQVIGRDRRLDRLEQETEEQVIRLIALRAPVASDLRLLVASMKMSTTLERVGDLSKSIARRGLDLSRDKPLPITASIARMGREAQRQLSEALDAFVSRDVEAAIAVWRRDVEIDALYNAVFRELITYMMEDPRTITLGSHGLFIAKNLERIGDHATHLAELTYYVAEGEPLTEERPRGPRGYGDGGTSSPAPQTDAGPDAGAESED
ncbi:MAG: phosphate signaling complex protein PhoU [Pseudomonadota bacterium]|nr:phosphate signaling complex protein PhoU [Pseudomonadota bacterium]MEE3098725.1 phosphate signaling complex protein PhoU [Pseudomonadota bacterium]